MTSQPRSSRQQTRCTPSRGLVLAAFLLHAAAAAALAQTIEIGRQLPLFLDDRLLASPGELPFVLHHPRAAEVAIRLDRPWEDDCPEIFGDEIHHTVRWTGGPDVSVLAGRAVRLRFAWKDGDLYSFRFG
jgi:hypothetical protein